MTFIKHLLPQPQSQKPKLKSETHIHTHKHPQAHTHTPDVVNHGIESHTILPALAKIFDIQAIFSEKRKNNILLLTVEIDNM